MTRQTDTPLILEKTGWFSEAISVLYRISD